MGILGGPEVTPEPSFRGLVLNHQGLENLNLEKHPKTAAVFGVKEFSSSNFWTYSLSLDRLLW